MAQLAAAKGVWRPVSHSWCELWHAPNLMVFFCRRSRDKNRKRIALRRCLSNVRPCVKHLVLHLVSCHLLLSKTTISKYMFVGVQQGSHGFSLRFSIALNQGLLAKAWKGSSKLVEARPCLAIFCTWCYSAFVQRSHLTSPVLARTHLPDLTLPCSEMAKNSLSLPAVKTAIPFVF